MWQFCILNKQRWVTSPPADIKANSWCGEGDDVEVPEWLNRRHTRAPCVTNWKPSNTISRFNSPTTCVSSLPSLEGRAVPYEVLFSVPVSIHFHRSCQTIWRLCANLKMTPLSQDMQLSSAGRHKTIMQISTEHNGAVLLDYSVQDPPSHAPSALDLPQYLNPRV